MEPKTIIALVIFFATYAAMLTERAHKTVAALLGGCLMILLHIVTERQAFESIDLSVLFLLTGMMVVAHFLALSGFFGYVAIKLAQFSKGRPLPLMVLLCLVTAGLSALVDNVTTVVLIAPVTFLIAEQLEISPIPYLLFEAMASNIGGTATLIGDPPNILIGSAAGLSFNEFLLNLGPVVILCLAVLLIVAVFITRKQGSVSRDIRAKVMDMNADRAIADRALLKKSGAILALVLVGLVTHDITHIHPATTALFGAGLLLLWTKSDPEDALKAVEWPTLFFFIGLFMVVSGLRATGVLDDLANTAVSLTRNDLFLTAMVFLWFSALASAFVGAVPVVTTLIPVIQSMIPQLAETGTPESIVRFALWWSLALGSCLGGNGTMFGTAANVVVIQIARSNRREISFGQFAALGMPIMLASLVISSVYVFVRYIH